MRSLITAQRFFRFSTILCFTMLRYNDCIYEQFEDAIHKKKLLNDILRFFDSFWRMFQRKLAVLVQKMLFNDPAR